MFPRLVHSQAAALWGVEYLDPELGLCRLWFESQREARRELLRRRRAEVTER
jgi:hypothetical protein